MTVCYQLYTGWSDKVYEGYVNYSDWRGFEVASLFYWMS